MSDDPHGIARAARTVRALSRAVVFFLKVFPMLPSRPVDWVTPAPQVKKVRYPSNHGPVEGELYYPGGSGPYPGMVVCLGVVPQNFEHPQVAVLGKALARAGFAGLLYWSPEMRDFRLDTPDLENIPLAFDWLIRQPFVDPARSGMIGTCVGGAYGLMAAAHPLIRERISYVSAYAPYFSMWTFARDIASGTWANAVEDGSVEPWQVDQLTRRVFIHSMAALLEPGEAERVRGAFLEAGGRLEGGLSPEGEAVCALLSAPSRAAAQAALDCLPPAIRARFDAISPMNYLKDIHAPLIVLLHDAGDHVIPVGESRRLVAALAGRDGAQYTEMHFSHLDPIKGKLPLHRQVQELSKFFRAMYPLFWHVTR